MANRFSIETYKTHVSFIGIFSKVLFIEDINLFEVDPLWISSRFYHRAPGIFHFFFFLRWPLWKSMFFSSNFGISSWNSNYFYFTPWNFPLVSSTEEGKNLFWKSPLYYLKLLVTCICITSFNKKLTIYSTL